MQCPDCDGAGSIKGYGCPGFRPITTPCSQCEGTGSIGEKQAGWRADGALMRQARLARIESAKEAAARLGIDLRLYCRMERGQVDPNPGGEA